MNGYILVNKEKNWTSFDVVKFLRGRLNCKKLGHSGTLDPLATGLLILLVNDYTKLSYEFTSLCKTYSFVIKLFETTTTGDAEGEVCETKEPISIEENQIKQMLSQSLGEMKLRVPELSAKKVNGQKLYNLKRKGKEVPVIFQDVKINTIEFISYKAPFLSIKANVSSGTYIRSLVQKIAKDLKTIGYMYSLERNSIGRFDVKDSKFVKKITKHDIIKKDDCKNY